MVNFAQHELVLLPYAVQAILHVNISPYSVVLLQISYFRLRNGRPSLTHIHVYTHLYGVYLINEFCQHLLIRSLSLSLGLCLRI